MIKGSCHCGAVTIIFDGEPEKLVTCNCSVCRKLAPLWGHGDSQQISVIGLAHTKAYIWGDRSLAFHSCKTCGCTTHWQSLKITDNNRMAMNMHLADSAKISHLRVRHFDGADTWSFID